MGIVLIAIGRLKSEISLTLGIKIYFSTREFSNKIMTTFLQFPMVPNHACVSQMLYTLTVDT